MSYKKYIYDTKTISFKLSPEEFDLLDELRKDVSKTKYIKSKIFITNDKINNKNIIDSILSKLVKSMIKARVSVDFTNEEMEVVKQYA